MHTCANKTDDTAVLGDLRDENGAAVPHNHKQPLADCAVPKNTVLSVNTELHTVPAITNTLSGGQ